jgi:hypothetical protein
VSELTDFHTYLADRGGSLIDKQLSVLDAEGKQANTLVLLLKDTQKLCANMLSCHYNKDGTFAGFTQIKWKQIVSPARLAKHGIDPDGFVPADADVYYNLAQYGQPKKSLIQQVRAWWVK